MVKYHIENQDNIQKYKIKSLHLLMYMKRMQLGLIVLKISEYNRNNSYWGFPLIQAFGSAGEAMVNLGFGSFRDESIVFSLLPITLHEP